MILCIVLIFLVILNIRTPLICNNTEIFSSLTSGKAYYLLCNYSVGMRNTYSVIHLINGSCLDWLEKNEEKDLTNLLSEVLFSIFLSNSPLHPLLPGPMLSNENSYLHWRGVQTFHMDRGRQCLSWISEHMWHHFYMGCFHKLQTGTVSPSTALGTHKTKSHDHQEGKSKYKINQRTNIWSFTHTHTHTHTGKITIRSVCGAFSSPFLFLCF